MIEVKRKDYPAETFRSRSGETRTVPARYTCSYRYNGLEIAKYYSTSDRIDLRTDYILLDFSKSKYERALAGKYAEAYRHLFEMLGADETTSFGEYTYA